MSPAEALGFVAGALTTFGFVPQLVRVFRLRSAREISLPFMILFLAGIVCWEAYGIYFRLPPVIIWNAITMVLISTLLYVKIKYGR